LGWRHRYKIGVSRMRTYATPPRRSITLGQVMVWIALLGSVFSLRVTIGRFEQEPSHLFVIMVFFGGYILYFLVLALALSGYLTRTQILGLAAVTAAITALLVQTLGDPTGRWALSSILVLPFVPLLLGGWQILRNRGSDAEDGPRSETETLSRLVLSKRQRGLMPQAAPAASDESAPTRSRLRATWARLAAWRSGRSTSSRSRVNA
jgi:hypothetical protein